MVLAIRRKVVLQYLNFDPNKTLDDLETVYRWSSNLNLDDQDRAVWLVRSPRLRGWLMPSMHESLLINGSESDLSTAAKSPVSFVSVQLIRSLATAKSILTVYWFCDQHKNQKRDDDANVARMLCSLIGQLLTQHHRFDLHFFKKYHLRGVEDSNVEVLCDIFDELVLQLPKDMMLFCVVDSVSTYEDRFRRDDIALAMKRLHHITTVPHNGIFKLLMTSPGRCLFIKDVIPRDNTLTMVDRVDGGRQGFSALAWDRSAGKHVEELERKLSRRNLVADKK